VLTLSRQGNRGYDFERENGMDLVVRRGMIVWGDLFGIAYWEVGDGFVKRWGWFLQGATDWEESTNV